MSGTMIAGIILFVVGVLVLIGGIVLASDEGDKYIAVGVIICVISITLMIGTACEAVADEQKAKTYPLTVKIITINRETDTVECVDGAGNVWEFFGCEDWQEGDFASLLMNDKRTSSIYDDEIIIARYAGTFEG